MTIQELLQLTIDRQASDMHLIPGYFPAMRVNGDLFQIKTLPLITSEMSEKMILSLLNDDQKGNFLANNEMDLAYEYGNFRFRVNAYRVKGAVAAALRTIPNMIQTMEQLDLPDSFHNLSDFNNGLVLVTGQTGEGKSTTLASIINEINIKYSKHIITIEDPIEFIYPPGRSIVSQRELHRDTHSWGLALKSVLREDPDVVLIGELRDAETIQAALTIAETGHLVFATLHTNSTSESINRIIDVFPSHQQNQVRAQLSMTLKTVITERLVPKANEPSRLAAFEILLNIPAVAATIRDGKIYQLDNILETSESKGLIILEKYLANLYRKGLITKEAAVSYANKVEEVKKFLGMRHPET